MDQELLTHMRAALTQAEAAAARGDLAVGAVIVLDGEVVGRGGNKARSTADPLAHAEMVALTDFTTRHPGLTLENALLVTTFEPCPMCLGASLVLRVGTIIVGGARHPQDQAWGRYRPEHLAATTATDDWELKVRPGPLGPECVRLRDATKDPPPHPKTTTREGSPA